jgi:NDP-sugar pyrophosphorylase family protein
MVPVLGRPLVERVLDTVVPHGIVDVVMVIGPGDDAIRRHFGDGTGRLRTRFVVQEQRLGMAHALALAAPLLRGPFLLSACDSITSAEHVGELLAASAGADAVLSLLEVEPAMVARSAAVELEANRVRRIVEKPSPGEARSTTVSLPIYLLPAEVLGLVGDVRPSVRGELELQDALQRLIDRGRRVVGVHARARRQVSTPGDLLALTVDLLRSRPAALAARIPDAGEGSVVRPPVWAGGGVRVGSGCEIGPDVALESGCRIGDGAVVSRAVVLPGAEVAPGESVRDRVVL